MGKGVRPLGSSTGVIVRGCWKVCLPRSSVTSVRGLLGTTTTITKDLGEFRVGKVPMGCLSQDFILSCLKLRPGTRVEHFWVSQSDLPSRNVRSRRTYDDETLFQRRKDKSARLPEREWWGKSQTSFLHGERRGKQTWRGTRLSGSFVCIGKRSWSVRMSPCWKGFRGPGLLEGQ